ncbi:MAG: hypothetical protein AAF993_19845 [Pseudomonadota bacterium]
MTGVQADTDDRFNFSVELGTRWESNINLGGDEVDPQFVGDEQLDDLTYQLAATVSYDLIKQPSREFSISLTGFYNGVDDFSDLTNKGVTLALQYNGEFGPAFTAPWYSINISQTYADFDSRIRDGDWLEAELQLGKRFTPKFGASFGVRYLDRNQDNSTRLCPERANVNCPGFWREDQVFDQERIGGFLHFDWFAADKTSLFFEYSYWEGDEDATVALRNVGATGRPGWLNIHDIFADDPAFGRYSINNNGNFVENGPLYIVWQVDVTQHVFELGIRQQLTDQMGLEFVVAHLLTSDVESPGRRDSALVMGDTELDDYDNTAVMLSFSFNF